MMLSEDIRRELEDELRREEIASLRRELEEWRDVPVVCLSGNELREWQILLDVAA